MPKRVMTTQEVADYLHIHTSTVYKLAKRGTLPSFRVGSDWRFNLTQVDEWRALQEQKVKAWGGPWVNRWPSKSKPS